MKPIRSNGKVCTSYCRNGFDAFANGESVGQDFSPWVGLAISQEKGNYQESKIV